MSRGGPKGWKGAAAALGVGMARLFFSNALV